MTIRSSPWPDPTWRAFEPRLHALGIDASATECRRLAGLERNPDVSYVAAFVSSSADKPIDLSAGPAAPLIMKIRDRMSFMRTREIREERLKDASAEEKFRHNAWELTGLADPGKPVVVPDLLTQRGWTDLDYLKIDLEFVRDLTTNHASQHVVDAVVSLAHGFGQKTIAEGVEDDEGLRMLSDVGVDYAQGYATGRPLPLTQVFGTATGNGTNRELPPTDHVQLNLDVVGVGRDRSIAGPERIHH